MKKIYFVTDAHFGALDTGSIERERKLVSFLSSIQDDCAQLYLLGDMIDFWHEYRYVVPKGFVRFLGKLAEFTDAGIPVYWFAGNHDMWMYGYLGQELGVEVINGPVVRELGGKRFYMAHGDGLGDPSFGAAFLHWMFHSPVLRWLYSNIFPTSLGMWIGQKWSKQSFMKRKRDGETRYLGEDKEYLICYAKRYVAEHPSQVPDIFMFGHRHIVLDFQLGCGSRVVIPGDWIHEFSYAVFDGEHLDIEFYEG